MEQKQLDEMEESFFEEFIDEEPSVSAGLDPLEQKIEEGKTGVQEAKKTKKVSTKSATKKSEKKAVSKKEELDSNAETKKEPEAEKFEIKEVKDDVEIRPAKESVSIKEVKDVQETKVTKVKDEPSMVKDKVVDPWKTGNDKEDSGMFKDVSTWKAITGVAVLLLVISLFTQGFNFSGPSMGSSASGISISEAEQKAVDYVNNNLLQPPFQAKVESSEALDNLYKITLSVDGQVVDSYLTKDGKVFFPQGFEIDNAGDLAATNSPVQVSADDDPVMGDEDAPVTIIEFSDFQCPYCGKFFSDTLPSIEKYYVNTGKAKLVFRDFPLPIHPNAESAALAAECAHEQGQFWAYHDYLFSNQADLSDANYKKWAEDLGLDTAKFNDCLDSKKYLSEVQADMADGQSYGVAGTPAFFINGKMVNGAQPYEMFQQEIDAALSAAGGSSVVEDKQTEQAEQMPVDENKSDGNNQEPQMQEPQQDEPAVEDVLTIPVNAKKWVFSPDNIDVKKGETIRLTILPKDLDFTFTIPELGVEKEVSGQTTVEFKASKTGTFQFECGSCEDWRGMTGTLTVK